MKRPLRRTARSAARSLAAVVPALVGRSPQERYEARHQVVAGLAASMGFRVYNRNLIWPDDPEYRATWARFPEASSTHVHDRHYTLYQLARSVGHLAGDSAECGVFAGAGSFLICSARQSASGPEPTQHLIFDSFQGLSAPQAEDIPAEPETFKWKEHDLSVSEQRVGRNLAAFDNVVILPGWIPSRFAEVEERRFAFVHVDVDLYQPTRDSIAFFFQRLVPGGILVCDDYGSTACPGARRAFDEVLANEAESVVALTTGQAFVIKSPE